MVYTKDNIDEYRQRLIDLGITNEDDMVKVMNFLDQVAEIGYDVYKKKQREENTSEE